MGSSYFGGSNLGNERSSRKGKRSNGNAEPNKPKQPQRGLGVAQLEKIRLLQVPQLTSAYPNPTLSQEDERMQTSYPMYTSSPSSSSSSYGFHNVPHDIMVRSAPLERTTTRYGDSRPSTTRWNATGNGILDAQQFAQHSFPEQFWNPQAEDFVQKRRNKSWSDSIDARQNFQAIDDEELDLELRL